jgi:Glycosyltransferase sugar-binding region containing DXD motif
MSQPLTSHQRNSLLGLVETKGLGVFVQRLATMAQQGFDVAGMPFRLMDRLLADGGPVDSDRLAELADLLPGGQPRLFRAICADLAGGGCLALAQVHADLAAHPMTRWEALCWMVFLRNRAVPAATGPEVRQICQFWDQPVPPPEIATAMADWQALGNWKRFDEATAVRFVARSHGEDAARFLAGLWHPAAKSDLFRLYWLHERGGVYVDADATPQPGISRFLGANGNQVWASAMTQVPHAVTINGFVAAPKGSPVIAHLIDSISRNLHDRPGGPIFWLCGPGAWTRALWRCPLPVSLMPAASLAQLFRQFDAPYKHTDRNWRVHEHQQGMKDEQILPDILAGT